ncbi:hypothetical protein JCM3770_007388 [Rhodotorula araucariae]
MVDAILASLAPQLNCEFTLTVVQQPVRARMCGLGDKDRRPISPPVLVQLRIVDRRTGEEIDVEDVDTTFLVLAADLRTADGAHDANIIYPAQARALGPAAPTSTASWRPSCSPECSPWGYPSPADSQTSSLGTPRALLESLPDEETALVAASLTVGALGPDRSSADLPGQSPSAGTKRPSSAEEMPASLNIPSPGVDRATPAPAKRARSTSTSSPTWTSAAAAPAAAPSEAYIPYARPRRTAPDSLPSSPPLQAADDEDARPPVPNLIGTLHTNAHKLRGLDGRRGVFFVLPDLSVRTEGAFRVRLRVVRIGINGARTQAAAAVVAVAQTDAFTVCSAKKFEGMLDPTPLSQCFAQQGVRIPTRRPVKARGSKAARGLGAGAGAGAVEKGAAATA